MNGLRLKIKILKKKKKKKKEPTKYPLSSMSTMINYSV